MNTLKALIGSFLLSIPCCALTHGPVASETVNVRRDHVAPALRRVLSGTIIHLRGWQNWRYETGTNYHGTYKRDESRDGPDPYPATCSNRTRSGIVFQPPLVRFQSLLKTREIRIPFTFNGTTNFPTGVSVNYINFGHNCWDRISVTTNADHFELRFRTASRNGIVTIDERCVRTDVNPFVNARGWTQECTPGSHERSWFDPTITIKLNP